MTQKKPNKLKDEHRAFLVREFACYSSPQEAADALKETFGIEITPQGAQHYDATSENGKRQAAKKWHELFEVYRNAFLHDIEKRVPEAHKSVRIQELAKASRAFKRSKNYLSMARMLEQLAREMGDAFSNRREFTGKDGGAIQYQDVSDMTDEQLDAELRQLLNIKDDADVHPAPDSEQ